MAKVKQGAAPITENEAVAQLLSILKMNHPPGLQDFTALLSQISTMQNQLDATMRELTAMRHDLAEAEKNNHPIRNTMQKAVITIQARVIELRDKLGDIKQAVIDGCKNAVAAIKEKGIAVLDSIARFFKVRPILEAIQAKADEAAKDADRAITNIDKAGARFHEAGRNLQNAGRALVGKDDILEVKTNGMAVKAFSAPYKAVSRCFKEVSDRAAVSAKKWRRLEEKAAERKQPVKEIMREYQEKTERESRDMPHRKAHTSPER